MENCFEIRVEIPIKSISAGVLALCLPVTGFAAVLLLGT